MSGPDDLGGEHPYDPVDLRRRIAVSFSTPELRQLAETLGVSGSIHWEHGPQEAVRDLVRQFERYYGLGTLVAKLRAIRPLVDWPEPDALPPPESQVKAPASIEPAPTDVPSAPPILDPLAPPPPAPTAPPIDPPPPSLAAPIAPPSRAAPVWPGTVASNPEPPRAQGIDARVLILVAGLTVLAAVIAYAAGRASNGAPPAPMAAAPDGTTSIGPAPLPRRAPGPATHAADAVLRGLAGVAKACELPAGTEPNAELLARAFERCGQPPPRAMMTVDRPPPSLPDPVTPPASPDPGTARTRPPRAGSPTPAPDRKAEPSTACLAACNGDSRSCYGACGAEPANASQNDGYMRCRSRCMSALSRCRLACPQ